MKSTRNVCIYIADYVTYRSLQEEIKTLYYKIYGQSLSKGEVLVKSMLVLKDSLVETAASQKEIPKVSRIFK